MVGYSGTPLAKKLGLKAGSNLALAGAPKDYPRLLEPMPAQARVSTRISSVTDIVHVFATKRKELESILTGCRSKR